VISSEGRGGTAGLGAGIKIAPLDYALTQCHAVTHYLRLALWPAPLVFDYGKATVTQLSAIVVPALVLLALVTGTVFALRRKPILGFLGVWFFAILAPSSSVVPVATQTIAEHRMYLSLAAVIALLVVALYRYAGRPVTLAAAFVAAIGLTVLASQRNAIYRDALTLWSDTAAKSPDNPRAITNLGLALVQAGRADEAQQHFAAAVQRLPNLPDLRINYSNVLAAAGRLDESAAQLEAALRLDPDSLEARNNLGITFAQRGRTTEAIAQFERAIKIKPTSADSHRNLGLALAQAGRGDEALAQLAKSVRLRPDDPIGRDFYGFALLQSGRLPEAIAELEAARRLDPQSARVRNRLGLAFASAGRMAEAVREFEQAVKLQPDFAEAARNLERARAELRTQ
jgi:Flp pilus assembly protein TadD